MNDSIKGCYYGITPEIKKEDLVSAALEGVAFSIRQEKGQEITIDDGVKYYYPNKENMFIYRNQYEKFKGLYPRLKDI